MPVNVIALPCTTEAACVDVIIVGTPSQVSETALAWLPTCNTKAADKITVNIRQNKFFFFILIF
jgi:hypothetical protein